MWRLISKAVGVYIYIPYKDKNRNSAFIKNILLFLLVQEFVCVTKQASVKNEDLKMNVIKGKILPRYTL